jgi:hypothetical protein
MASFGQHRARTRCVSSQPSNRSASYTTYYSRYHCTPEGFIDEKPAKSSRAHGQEACWDDDVFRQDCFSRFMAMELPGPLRQASQPATTKSFVSKQAYGTRLASHRCNRWITALTYKGSESRRRLCDDQDYRSVGRNCDRRRRHCVAAQEGKIESGQSSPACRAQLSPQFHDGDRGLRQDLAV